MSRYIFGLLNRFMDSWHASPSPTSSHKQLPPPTQITGKRKRRDSDENPQQHIRKKPKVLRIKSSTLKPQQHSHAPKRRDSGINDHFSKLVIPSFTEGRIFNTPKRKHEDLENVNPNTSASKFPTSAQKRAKTDINNHEPNVSVNKPKISVTEFLKKAGDSTQRSPIDTNEKTKFCSPFPMMSSGGKMRKRTSVRESPYARSSAGKKKKSIDNIEKTPPNKNSPSEKPKAKKISPPLKNRRKKSTSPGISPNTQNRIEETKKREQREKELQQQKEKEEKERAQREQEQREREQREREQREREQQEREQKKKEQMEQEQREREQRERALRERLQFAQEQREKQEKEREREREREREAQNAQSETNPERNNWRYDHRAEKRAAERLLNSSRWASFVSSSGRGFGTSGTTPAANTAASSRPTAAASAFTQSYPRTPQKDEFRPNLHKSSPNPFRTTNPFNSASTKQSQQPQNPPPSTRYPPQYKPTSTTSSTYTSTSTTTNVSTKTTNTHVNLSTKASTQTTTQTTAMSSFKQREMQEAREAEEKSALSSKISVQLKSETRGMSFLMILNKFGNKLPIVSDNDYKKAYKKLLVKYHPDKQHTADLEKKTRAEEIYKLLQNALNDWEKYRR